MQAVILMGGLGTRLAGMFPDIPKALVPVGERLFIERQLDWLTSRGVRKVHLAAGRHGEKVRQWIDSTPHPGVELTLSLEPQPLGTGGGLKFTEPFLRSDPLLILNGDSLLPELDLTAMYAAHFKSQFSVTMALTPVENTGRYGLVALDGNQRVIGFREKAEAVSGMVNGGVYLFTRDIVNDIPPVPAVVSLERDVFPRLAADGMIQGFATKPPLLDMGTPEGLRRMINYHI